MEISDVVPFVGEIVAIKLAGSPRELGKLERWDTDKARMDPTLELIPYGPLRGADPPRLFKSAEVEMIESIFSLTRDD